NGWTLDAELDADSVNIARGAFAAGGSRLVAATADKGVRLWDMATRELVSLEGEDEWHDTAARALAVAADGGRFAIGNDAGRVDIREAASGALVDTLPEQGFSIGALAFIGDGSTVAVSCGFPCTANEGTPVWPVGGDAPSLTYAGHDGTVFASAV